MKVECYQNLQFLTQTKIYHSFVQNVIARIIYYILFIYVFFLFQSDVFALPHIKEELSKYKKDWLDMKLKLGKFSFDFDFFLLFSSCLFTVMLFQFGTRPVPFRSTFYNF